MFDFSKLFKKEELKLSRDAIAELLKTTPEALKAFEEKYKEYSSFFEPNDTFGVNSRQASSMRKSVPASEPSNISVEEIKERVIAELLAKTESYHFDGNLKSEPVKKTLKALPDGTAMVSNEEIVALPEEQRPQLTGTLMKIQVSADSSEAVLMYYQRMLKAKNPGIAKEMYHHFRQGLDILDLDMMLYEIIGMNKNSMGYWFPMLVEACREQEFFRIPATTIVKVPMPLLQLTRIDYGDLTRTTMDIVNRWAQEAFHLDLNGKYFIKTGTYSSKFDFRNAKVTDPKEIMEIGEYLLYIHFQALQMASPLASPTIYGVSTTNEWVVREYIDDIEHNPCIYEGLPLHTEYRVFVDCDTDEVLGISPYWKPDTMKKRFSHGADADTPKMKHDYVIYKMHEETLMKRYTDGKDKVIEHIKEILPGLDLLGQWSIDIMQNGDDFWIIDMALAENSAFYECVPENLRRPLPEEWLPAIPDIKAEQLNKKE